MPGGDPGLLEQLAARLEAIAQGSADLGASTRQVTASIRSEAVWTGDAADAYTAFTGNLAQGVAAAPAPLYKIALAVRDYAGCLQTAQEKVAVYASAAGVAEVNGNDSGYVSAAQTAAQNASAAVAAWQAAGDRAAAAVNAAGAQLQLGDLFGSQGPVTSSARPPASALGHAGWFPWVERSCWSPDSEDARLGARPTGIEDSGSGAGSGDPDHAARRAGPGDIVHSTW